MLGLWMFGILALKFGVAGLYVNLCRCGLQVLFGTGEGSRFCFGSSLARLASPRYVSPRLALGIEVDSGGYACNWVVV